MAHTEIADFTKIAQHVMQGLLRPAINEIYIDGKACSIELFQGADHLLMGLPSTTVSNEPVAHLLHPHADSVETRLFYGLNLFIDEKMGKTFKSLLHALRSITKNKPSDIH